MTDDEFASRRDLLGLVAAAGAGLAGTSALAGQPAAAPALAPGQHSGPADMVMEPSTAKLSLEHLFDARIDFGPRRQGKTLPWGGTQGYTPVGPRGGIVRGPRLNGKVVESSGADYAFVRGDGVLDLNAHYLLEADDGTLIYIENRGYGYQRKIICTPRFKVEKGPHDWLTHTVIVGTVEPRREPVDHSIFSYYGVVWS